MQQDAPRFVNAAMNNGVQAEGLKICDSAQMSAMSRNIGISKASDLPAAFGDIHVSYNP
jgi:hypothetical protein